MPEVERTPTRRPHFIKDAPRLERPLHHPWGGRRQRDGGEHPPVSSALLAAGRPHSTLLLSGVTHMTPQEEVAENLLLVELDFFRRLPPPAQPDRRAAEAGPVRWAPPADGPFAPCGPGGQVGRREARAGLGRAPRSPGRSGRETATRTGSRGRSSGPGRPATTGSPSCCHSDRTGAGARRWSTTWSRGAAGDLDVAPGTAGVAIQLTRRTGARIVAVDLSPEMLREGSSTGRVRGLCRGRLRARQG